MIEGSKISIEQYKSEIDSQVEINISDDADKTTKKKGGRKKKIVEKPFKCSCCGEPYTTQQRNFSRSQSAFYQANDGYITVCNKCIEKSLKQYTKTLGSEEKAIERLALHFDLFVSPALLRTNGTGMARFKKYVKGCNLTQNNGKTYDTYLDSINKDLVSYNTVFEECNLTKEQVERWGTQTYSLDEINVLEDHYQYLKKCNPNVDNNQEIFIKDLCVLNLLKIKAIKKDDVKRNLECSKEYRETFKTAGLKTIVETDDSKNATFGVTLATIEQFTPSEYYKDKKLFKDFDGIGNAWERHVFRPLKNFIYGTKEKDSEYNISEEK